MKLTKKDIIIDIILITVLVTFTLMILYPFYFAILYSIQGVNYEAVGIVKYFVPSQINFEGYTKVFSEESLYKAMLVTLARTLLGTTLSVLFTAAVSYSLSKKKLHFRKVYLKLGVITMYFGAGLIPIYILYSNLNLLDSFWVYILPGMFSFFYAILFITFFSSIPSEIEESAYIDGASDLKIFIKIYMPLSTPVIATIALFNGVGHWNAWFDSAFFVNNPDLQTLQAILYRIITASKAANEMQKYMRGEMLSQSYLDSIKFATMIIAMLPVTLAYPFLQKYFVKGMMVGSVKG